MADFNKIAAKWQKKWKEADIFGVKESPKKKKYYCLEMYPYPSSTLHMGHLRNYSIGDCFARYKRMGGYNVLYPIGYDSFGLPAENAAIKNKINPEKWTRDNISAIKKQQKGMGLSYDWGRKISSMEPDYYKWNQWIFLQFYKKGIAYRKKAYVNWCNDCGTVLANEQVHNGKCWRCGSDVGQKELEQWFFKIRGYAEELLKGLDNLEWPERVKVMQKNWIGKSEGTTIGFEIKGTKEKINIFTTRADTLFGATFMVFAPEHPLAKEWVIGTEYEKNFKRFLKEAQKEGRFSRLAEGVEKKGMFIGKYAIHPLTNEEIPVYAGNFVVYEYGAGAVMAVPAHDQRDFEFAKKYNLPIKIVIQPDDYDINANKMSRAYLEDGHLANSGEFNGLKNRDAIIEITKKLKELKKGETTINYKLRDWLISRQRYWGTPIPIVYCDKCGIVPVPYEDLPVKLPEAKYVEFTGQGNPLEKSKKFANTKCPRCKSKAKRETDTMDTFVDSSWYFFRYCDPKNSKKPFGKDADYWMPVDQYIGGIEHAVMHLLYARFFTKALRDLGLHNIDEPFTRLLCQGMVIKDGAKMSKSLGNVVEPNVIMDKYGPDTARLFILFAALPEKELEWSDQGVSGAFRFLNKIYRLLEFLDNKNKSNKKSKNKKLSTKEDFLISKMHITIKRVTEFIEWFKLSMAIGAIMEFANEVSRYKHDVGRDAYKEALRNLALLIAPFTPHIAEDMWEKLGNKNYVSLEKWPAFDIRKIDKKAEASEEMIHRTISDINKVLELIKIKKPSKIKLIVSAKWKFLFLKMLQEEMQKTRDFRAIINVLMDEKELKQHGMEISKILPSLLKDARKIPSAVLSQKAELESLGSIADKLKEEFGCDAEIEKAEDSKEEKAKTAMPGKAAIIIN